MEMPLIIVIPCVVIAGWAAIGAIGAIAQRLDDQVRLHQLKLNIARLHSRYRDAVMFEPIEEVGVDLMPDDEAPIFEAGATEPIQLHDDQPMRKAA